jgi:methylglutaconyl-CoA hydratase
MQEAYVTYQVNDQIGTIEFYHPQSNSLPGAILNLLAETIRKAGSDPLSKVLVLRSGGDRAFCAGASFDELIAIDSEPQGKEFFSGFAKVINAMRTCPKFIIGRVQGKTVGGGVGLACATDYCFATKHASVKLSELAVGIGPFVVGPAVERKVGKAAFSEMAIAASEWRSAGWAQACGMFTSFYDDTAAMDEAVAAFAQKVSTYNPEAMSAMKSIFWEGTEHWDDLLLQRAQVSGTLVLSEFTRNAIASFKAK